MWKISAPPASPPSPVMAARFGESPGACGVATVWLPGFSPRPTAVSGGLLSFPPPPQPSKSPKSSLGGGTGGQAGAAAPHGVSRLLRTEIVGSSPSWPWEDRSPGWVEPPRSVSLCRAAKSLPRRDEEEGTRGTGGSDPSSRSAKGCVWIMVIFFSAHILEPYTDTCSK